MRHRETIGIFRYIHMKNIFISLLFFFVISMGATLFAEELIFPPGVLKKYESSLNAIDSGNIEEFSEKVLNLKNEVYLHGLLSINSFVDDALSRSFALEREKRLMIIKEALQVSPLNVKYWLFLGLNDLLDFQVFAFWENMENLYYATLKNPVPLLKSIIIMFGFFVFFLLLFSFFYSFGILFKYSPSIVSDVLRLKPLKRVRFAVTPLFMLFFLLSVYLIRSPFTVLFFWLVVFSPYMNHREVFLTILIGVVFYSTMFLNSKVSVYSQTAVFPARKNLLHLAHGIATGVKNVEIDLSGNSLIFSAGRVRYSFLRGNYRESIKIAEDLEKKLGEEYGILASMGKFYLGDRTGALSKLIDVHRNDYKDPVILFNLYQLYMTDYNFSKAAEIQKSAWKDLSNNRPFRIDPSKIGEKILVPPSISGKYLEFLLGDMGKEGYKKLPFYNLWLNPWGSSDIYFIVMMAVLILLRFLTYNRYIILACRVCGDKQLWKVSLKKEDICSYCKSKSLLVKGLYGNPEKLYQIKNYKRALRIKSLIVPGFGFLSAGAVSIFFIINLVFSSLMGFFILFYFAFPGEYSPLYAILSRLGTVVGGVLVIGFYIFTLISNELFLKRVHKKYKIEGF